MLRGQGYSYSARKLVDIVENPGPTKISLGSSAIAPANSIGRRDLAVAVFRFSLIVLAACYTPWDVRVQHSSNRPAWA